MLPKANISTGQMWQPVCLVKCDLLCSCTHWKQDIRSLFRVREDWELYLCKESIGSYLHVENYAEWGRVTQIKGWIEIHCKQYPERPPSPQKGIQRHAFIIHLISGRNIFGPNYGDFFFSFGRESENNSYSSSSSNNNNKSKFTPYCWISHFQGQVGRTARDTQWKVKATESRRRNWRCWSSDKIPCSSFIHASGSAASATLASE